MEARYASGIDDVWAALTDRDRLARWYGELDGDLRRGGDFTLAFSPADGKAPDTWTRAYLRRSCG